jgi:hypothetical protein
MEQWLARAILPADRDWHLSDTKAVEHIELSGLVGHLIGIERLEGDGHRVVALPPTPPYPV